MLTTSNAVTAAKNSRKGPRAKEIVFFSCRVCLFICSVSVPFAAEVFLLEPQSLLIP